MVVTITISEIVLFDNPITITISEIVLFGNPITITISEIVLFRLLFWKFRHYIVGLEIEVKM